MQPSQALINPPLQTSPYRFERINIDRLNDMTYLYMTVYGILKRKDFFLKKYHTAFTVVSYTGFLAYDDTNLPVAFYGVIPCFIEYNGHLVLAAQSADTMTHPDHRNKGLFVQLAERTFELCRKEGIRLIFGFPNQNSINGFVNKLGWQVTGGLERFTIAVKTFPLEKAAARFGLFNNLYLSYAGLYIKKSCGIANSLLDDGFAGVYRDEEFLTYKTYNQTFTAQIGSATVWLKIQKGLMIGDCSLSGENFDTVVSGLLKLAKRLGLQQVSFQVSAANKLYNRLKIYADPVPSYPIAIKDLGSGIPPGKLQFAFADTDIF